MRGDEYPGITVFSASDGEWDASNVDFAAPVKVWNPTRMVMGANDALLFDASARGLVNEASTTFSCAPFQCIRIITSDGEDGRDVFWMLDGVTGGLVAASLADISNPDKSFVNYAAVVQGCVSPDGRYAMLRYLFQGEHKLAMIRLSDMASIPVDVELPENFRALVNKLTMQWSVNGLVLAAPGSGQPVVYSIGAGEAASDPAPSATAAPEPEATPEPTPEATETPKKSTIHKR